MSARLKDLAGHIKIIDWECKKRDFKCGGANTKVSAVNLTRFCTLRKIR